MSQSWLTASGADVILSLHIQPGAKKTEVVGLHGEALKVRLAAPPVDGKANDALVAFLAETLGVTKARVGLVSGASSRAKRLRISDYGVEAAVQRLQGK
ncbi:MAG: YggU family protein [Rhodocyclaceae bacterium]|nr:YggU family protein [Rhodocyclaceae bacterium]